MYLQFIAVVARLILYDLTRDLHRAPLYYLFVHTIVGKIGGIHALHHVARGAYDDKGKARHLADAVDHALKCDHFVHMRGKIFILHAGLVDLSVYFFHIAYLFIVVQFILIFCAQKCKRMRTVIRTEITGGEAPSDICFS